MWKQAWKSYIVSLHPRNYKKIKDVAVSFVWMYWLVLNPILIDVEHTGESTEQIWFYIANLTPYILIWWSDLSGRLPITKQMYLLPMNWVDRKKYAQNLLFIKIVFPVMMGLILQIIYGCIYKIEPFRIFACMVAVGSWAIGKYVCSTLRSKFDREIKYAVKGDDGTGKDAVLNWACMVYAAVFHFVAAGVEIGFAETEPLWSRALCLLIPMSVMIIMDIAIIKTRYENTLIDAWNYEEAFHVLGKVIK